ncbi:MAG: LysR family transcriptional regulator cys regulon transcriptional activator [Gallionellaceae bacterium]|nr:MAG: LysR family transcriptional regulator cys regulon transcriptional activator [Gallionellaceae bacterium]
MNLQQLRYLNEIARRGLKISDAAQALYTSQPGISKQIKLLEEELGVEIFVRNGKRISALTEPGKAVLGIAQRILQDTGNLKQVGQEFSGQDSGSLTIATTHTQARYALPAVVKQFIARYPKVKLGLHQGSPEQIAQQVFSGEADIAIATESLALHDELVTLPCYEWQKADAGENRAVPHHHLRLRLQRARQNQRRFRGAQARPQYRAHRH